MGTFGERSPWDLTSLTSPLWGSKNASGRGNVNNVKSISVLLHDSPFGINIINMINIAPVRIIVSQGGSNIINIPSVLVNWRVVMAPSPIKMGFSWAFSYDFDALTGASAVFGHGRELKNTFSVHEILSRKLALFWGQTLGAESFGPKTGGKIRAGFPCICICICMSAVELSYGPMSWAIGSGPRSY